MQSVTHESIERRAYELWEQAGRPFGQSEEFWFRASTELATGGAAPKKARKATAPKTKAATSTKAKAVTEPAAKPKKSPAKTAGSKTAAKKKN
jgi:hypothetical protein